MCGWVEEVFYDVSECLCIGAVITNGCDINAWWVYGTVVTWWHPKQQFLNNNRAAVQQYSPTASLQSYRYVPGPSASIA